MAHADGSKPVQMTNNFGRSQGSPCWSPDGRWIAFDSQGQDRRWDLYVMDASGGRPRRITPDDTSAKHTPFWSHDGKWIYFRSDRTGRNEIWRVPFAGGTAEEVTRDGGVVDVFFYSSPQAPPAALPAPPRIARPSEAGRQWPP